MTAKSLNKPFMYYDEIDGEEEYSKTIEQLAPVKFSSQGQLKLLLGELFFLNKLHVHGILDGATIIYIGSSPGTHIKWLYDYFTQIGIVLQWILIDGRKHDVMLSKLRYVTLVHKFCDEEYLRELKRTNKNARIVLISDIRSKKSGDEPSTEDLLSDYSLQNMMLSILKPVASSLKWRCPFPDQWVKEFYIPTGREMLQPFAPPYSAELRIINIYTSDKAQLRLITIEDAKIYERKMFYYNNTVRKKVIINFDYPNQEYDFFLMYYILRSVYSDKKFSSTKEKVLFLQQSIFKFLKIPLTVTTKLNNEQTQHKVPSKNPVPKGKGRARPVRDNK
ncbi:poly(a) polymerase small subunit [Pteropox virus]|uniref:Cap-specific mRNA (nucleoside-2'-O-)-methyltransferase n=1 Tax=Pteropox virus TaxID=1873698 RepID=A0A1B1MRK3_9POXV|nr:poly(a) polymerase small subunit [Pteropox virus]ANS71155.1 poly(a) polymerase small subunit [Pteropox virus]